MIIFKYLSYVVRHKWYVFLMCYKYGIIWRGLTHDLSKLLPSELFSYARYFYGTPGRDIRYKRDISGYYKPIASGDSRFEFAWLLHQKRNDHHWQWWVLPEDDGQLKVLPMSKGARTEMLCDWFGAGKAMGNPNTKWWYLRNSKRIIIDDETRLWIESELGIR